MKLIRNGLIIDTYSKKEYVGDILTEGKYIKAIDKPGSFAQLEGIDEVIDATDKLVTPGLIDIHIHLREPGEEWKETIQSGALAAIHGGFTTVCCMPNTNPVNDKEEITKYILSKSKEAGLCKVYPIGAVSNNLEGKEMAPLSELKNAGCVAFSDDGYPVYDSNLMRRALEWTKMFGGIITCHEEDSYLSNKGSMNESPLSFKLGLVGWPKVAEEVLIARDIELARITKSRVHICHVTTKRGVTLIRRAKEDGIPITGETALHYLLLNEKAVEGYNTYAKINPPLRNEEDSEALLEGLIDGTLDAIASDHAPHDDDSKIVEFEKAANGSIGLQSTLPLTLELIRKGKISRMRAFEALTISPAKVFSLKEGKLLKGELADLTIIDYSHKYVYDKSIIKSKSTNSVFLEREMQGIASNVIIEGVSFNLL